MISSHLKVIADSPTDRVGFIGTQNNLKESSAESVLVVGTGISVLEQEVSQWNFEANDTNCEKYDESHISNLGI